MISSEFLSNAIGQTLQSLAFFALVSNGTKSP